MSTNFIVNAYNAMMEARKHFTQRDFPSGLPYIRAMESHLRRAGQPQLSEMCTLLIQAIHSNAATVEIVKIWDPLAHQLSDLYEAEEKDKEKNKPKPVVVLEVPCVHCRKEIPDDSNVCPFCEVQRPRCPQCNSVNHPNANFCRSCGAAR